MEMPSQGYSQAGCRESSAKVAFKKSLRVARVSCPSPFNPFILSTLPVPVGQRIEQGFPKTKLAFLQEFADILSSAQMPLFKAVQ